MIFMALLSEGGRPQVLGFPPKWLVIQAVITNGLTQVAAILVTTSQVILHYYFKISYWTFIRVKKSNFLGFLDPQKWVG
jgi:NADH:ubiquinone oxidoreductase subunit 2 (subunit N)